MPCRALFARTHPAPINHKRFVSSTLSFQRRLGSRLRCLATLMPQSETIKIIAVGDIHGAWNDASELALQFLKPDLLCLLGDFGNEDVPLVKRLAALPHSMVAILGNHDAWFSLNASGRKRALRVAHMSALPNALPSPTAVADQLAALNEQHVGYTSTRFPDLGLSVVGGRPFSKGGPRWDDVADFYKEYYDIKSLEESAFKLMDTALDVSHSYPDDMCILLSHNGPTGLGETRFSPCGVDWQDVEGDYGDPDLEEALDMLRAQKSCPTLILFGHMHHTLKGGGLRNRISIKNNSIILNCAVVPRIRKTAQHFVEIMVKNGQVESANDIWVDIDEDGGCQEIARHSLIEQDNGCMSCREAGIDRLQKASCHLLANCLMEASSMSYPMRQPSSLQYLGAFVVTLYVETCTCQHVAGLNN